MIQVGDTVRFLNAVGGGKISRIDTAKKLVYVEDEDGFELPVLPQECVVVNNIKENNMPTKPKATTATQAPVQAPVPDKFVPAATPKAAPVYETAEGDTCNTLLAFVPNDLKQLQTTECSCILINDSNYFLFYNIAQITNGEAHSVANGIIEPNMQETLCNVDKHNLNAWAELQAQIIPFKQNKNYQPQRALDIALHINPVKFCKLHAFSENDYFDKPAMLLHLQEESNRERLSQVSASEIAHAMHQKEAPSKQMVHKKNHDAQILEIDLHIDQLLDNTIGMDNAAMLAYQLEVFHKTMHEHRKQRGQKIVFIHGKGEGVLRSELEKALKSQYKNCRFQDASFREYGFGATLVTIGN